MKQSQQTAARRKAYHPSTAPTARQVPPPPLVLSASAPDDDNTVPTRARAMKIAETRRLIQVYEKRTDSRSCADLTTLREELQDLLTRPIG